LREPAVGEFGTGPAFVSNSRKPRRVKSRNREQVIALRAEFVVKPGKEENVSETIDAILENSFQREQEFLQALVMVSELESRLVTVITFWNSDGFAEARERRVNWLRQKLSEYLDQTLRVQTFCARVLGAKEVSQSEEDSSLADVYSPATTTFAAVS